jgi:hypothetical protein
VIAMTLKLYAHPFSSYCQKVLTALYENGLIASGCSRDLHSRAPSTRPVRIDRFSRWARLIGTERD